MNLHVMVLLTSHNSISHNKELQGHNLLPVLYYNVEV